MLKTALIGFGKVADTMRHDTRMARYFPDASHAQVLSRHEALDWKAVVDPSPEACERAKAEWQVDEAVCSIAELETPQSYECAVIASPPQGRLEILDAMPSLKAVLVEKPLGRTVGEAREFVEACEKRNIVVQVNYWRRAVPAFLALSRGELADKIGDIQVVFGLFGNGLLNNGSHLVDFLRMLCGEISSVESGSKLAPATASSVGSDQQVACQLRLANGGVASLAPVDFSHWREVGLDIWGSKGRLSIMQESLSMTMFPLQENRGLEDEMEIDSSSGETSDIEVGGCLQAMYDSLVAGIDDATALLCPASDALKSETIVHDIMRLSGQEA